MLLNRNNDNWRRMFGFISFICPNSFTASLSYRWSGVMHWLQSQPHANNRFFRLVKSWLQIHSRFFSHSRMRRLRFIRGHCLAALPWRGATWNFIREETATWRTFDCSFRIFSNSWNWCKAPAKNPNNCVSAALCMSLRPHYGLLLRYWCRKDKAFCERLFALYRQRSEKDKQHDDLDPPEKISANAHCGQLF